MSNENEDWKELITDVDGFWDEDVAPIVRGKVTSITEMVLARRETNVAVILLTAPCVAVTGSGKEKKEVNLDVGEAIGVVLKHKLADIPSMVDNQCEVEIKAKEKIDLDNGNTMWRYGIRYRGQRTGLAVPRSRKVAPGATGSQSSGNPEADAEDAMKKF